MSFARNEGAWVRQIQTFPLTHFLSESGRQVTIPSVYTDRQIDRSETSGASAREPGRGRSSELSLQLAALRLILGTQSTLLSRPYSGQELIRHNDYFAWVRVRYTG